MTTHDSDDALCDDSPLDQSTRQQALATSLGVSDESWYFIGRLVLRAVKGSMFPRTRHHHASKHRSR